MSCGHRSLIPIRTPGNSNFGLFTEKKCSKGENAASLVLNSSSQRAAGPRCCHEEQEMLQPARSCAGHVEQRRSCSRDANKNSQTSKTAGFVLVYPAAGNAVNVSLINSGVVVDD